jgi:ATP-dependent 26S proteasome regulatory subunit
MKLEKAPQETYADIGGLDQQIQVRTIPNIFRKAQIRPLLYFLEGN